MDAPAFRAPVRAPSATRCRRAHCPSWPAPPCPCRTRGRRGRAPRRRRVIEGQRLREPVRAERGVPTVEERLSARSEHLPGCGRGNRDVPGRERCDVERCAVGGRARARAPARDDRCRYDEDGATHGCLTPPGGIGDATSGAHHPCARSHSTGIEVRPVGTHAPSGGSVTLHAIALLVARHAALESLPRRTPVLQEPQGLRVVERAVAPPTRRPPDAHPLAWWQDRQKTSVLWHDWHCRSRPYDSGAWRTTKFAAWNRRRDPPA